MMLIRTLEKALPFGLKLRWNLILNYKSQEYFVTAGKVMRNSNRIQLTFTYTKSTTETLEKDVNYVQI